MSETISIAISIENAKNETRNQSERILHSVGLDMKDLSGKVVLDAGSGKRWLERAIKEDNVEATVISFDKRQIALKSEGNNGNTAVQGNALDGLPFQDKCFDLIINVGGPIRGGPWNETALSVYLDALRTLKEGGELRSIVPFLSEGGIGTYFYNIAQEGEIDISREEIDEYLEENNIHDVDAQGLPEENDSFWIDYSLRYSKDEQKDLNNYIAEELCDALAQQGIQVMVDMREANEHEKKFVPYMVMKKIC